MFSNIISEQAGFLSLSKLDYIQNTCNLNYKSQGSQLFKKNNQVFA